MQDSLPKIAIVATLSVAAMSYYFFRSSPRVKRRFSKLPFTTQLMSHRGGAFEFVENTLPGFKYSAKLGVDILELDVHLTKDGEVVVFHDNNLGRLCGEEYKTKKVGDYEYAELPKLKVPESLSGLLHVTNDPDSTRMPKLSELFDACPTSSFQIDVKSGPEELIVKVGKMILERKLDKHVVWYLLLIQGLIPPISTQNDHQTLRNQNPRLLSNNASIICPTYVRSRLCTHHAHLRISTDYAQYVVFNASWFHQAHELKRRFRDCLWRKRRWINRY
jgi:Glycerophosphoryl diester phosphodiesterase family